MTKLKAIGVKVREFNTRRLKPAPKAVDPFYQSPEWRSLMERIIAKRGRACEDLEHDPERSRIGIRIFGDHVVELRDGGAALDEANILLRCGSCHTRKTAIERAKRRAS